VPYFTFKEYILGSVIFFITGCFYSFAYTLLKKISDSFWVNIKLVAAIFKSQNINNINNLVFKVYYWAESEKRSFCHLADLISAVMFSISIIILNYCIFDGVVRSFPIILSLLSFLIFLIPADLILTRFWNILWFLPRLVILYSLYVISLPLKFVYTLIIKISFLFYNPIVLRIKCLISNRIAKRKLNNLRKFISQ